MVRGYLKKRRIKKSVEIEDAIMTITEKEQARIETPLARKGLVLMWYLILLVILVISGRIFYLDFIRWTYYIEAANGNSIRQIAIKAPRGEILDKNGYVLASNSPSMDAVIIPSDLPSDQGQQADEARTVASILGLDEGNVVALIESQDLESPDPVLLQENITQDQALILSEKASDLPGVIVDETAIRNYDDGPVFSDIIGYDGKITKKEMDQNHDQDYLMTDYIGKTGLEKSYEAQLRGVHGAKQVEIDSKGDVQNNLETISPTPGDDLILSIDSDLQKKLYDSMAAILQKTNTQQAAAVAIDPQTGGVLAMASLPDFDNNLFAKGISNNDYKNLISDPNLPLFNRATSGEYPPGSTIKPAVAAAALSEGVITPTTIINGQGGAINIGGFRFGDWTSHAPSDVRTAIAQSNDVFFYTVGGGYGGIQGLGMSRMKKYENLFGFGSPTSIDLPTEANGFIPDENWKLRTLGEKWYIGDSYHCAIGQGFVTVTPLQLANYTAAIANGGTLYAPRVVSKIRKPDGQEETVSAPIVRQNFISPDIMQILREGMRQTVTGGTAQILKTMPIAVAAKTGTAQFGTQDKEHSWFISFAPYDHPTIAMAVIVEGGGEGNSAALPVTQAVYQWYFTQDKNSSQ